ncbi:MAG: class IV adenylate cyclase [Planctomycetaceae bacterium]|nr:class IV adenylate cyclase [Planctomycetaceae bacterium]
MSLFEVEIKFQLHCLADFERQLQQLTNVPFGEQVAESDVFYQHPCRDFTQTDECLRLRSRLLPYGTAEYSLTYKGPKLDSNTKTRREVEIPITVPELVENMLTALGFQEFACVRKTRRRLALAMNNRAVEIVFDTLPALPESRRYFVEIETLAGEQDLAECRALVLDIAQRLGLTEPIRDSYLKLVQNAESLPPV